MKSVSYLSAPHICMVGCDLPVQSPLSSMLFKRRPASSQRTYYKRSKTAYSRAKQDEGFLYLLSGRRATNEKGYL